MNTAKEVARKIVKTLVLVAFSVLAAISSAPSLAQLIENPQAQALTSATLREYMAPVVYRNAAIENPLAGDPVADQAPSLANGAKASRKLRVIRTRDMSVAGYRSNMFTRDDRASFTVNAPMPAVNGALTFAGTALQVQLDDTLTTWVQLLSLAATRKINAELAYAARIDKDSRFDSVIAYKLRPNSGSGKPVVVASIRYGIRF